MATGLPCVLVWEERGLADKRQLNGFQVLCQRWPLALATYSSRPRIPVSSTYSPRIQSSLDLEYRPPSPDSWLTLSKKIIFGRFSVDQSKRQTEQNDTAHTEHDIFLGLRANAKAVAPLCSSHPPPPPQYKCAYTHAVTRVQIENITHHCVPLPCSPKRATGVPHARLAGSQV